MQDLVHLLLPLLPASEQCLLDVARLGNPREVVLKVAEALRILELDGLEEPSEEEEDAEPPIAKDSSLQLPLVVQQYQMLLSMLTILHPRIKTKYPSRFLSTSLQAVLAAYSKAAMFHDELTAAAVQFIKGLSGTKRPVLPPRRSSSQMLLATSAKTAPDPEAQADPPSEEEIAMQRRLLQSLVTHVFEDYMFSLHSPEDVPGLAWSSRLEEKLHPERLVPGKETYHERYEKSDKLQLQLGTVGQLVALAQDLEINSEDLLEIATDDQPEGTGHPEEEDEPPVSPKDVPLSKTGSLFLLTARKAAEELYSRQSSTPSVPIFPTHALLLKTFVGGASRATFGLEPESLIDAILFLGLQAIENDNIGEPSSDEDFAEYLQSTSLLSANTPSPSLRFAAHYLTSTVLRSHPTDIVRLSFIRDTLEHCPYSNLKASAAGWLKGETLDANPPPGVSQSSTSATSAPPEQKSADDSALSIFATPVAISTLCPFLFPDLTSHFSSSEPLAEPYLQFREELSFYLASLNFYYLLLIAKHLHNPLDVEGLDEIGDVSSHFVGPLKSWSAKFKAELGEGGKEELTSVVDEESAGEARMELEILDEVIGRVEEAKSALGQK